MRPAFQILADGADVTANIRDRLLSLSYHDEAETKSDRLTLKLDDRPRAGDGAFVALPEVGARLELSLGYQESGLVAVGGFSVDEIAYSGPPATLEIKAKAAEMTGAFRSHTSRSWHDTTLGAIVEDVAAAHGYQVRADPRLAAVPIAHEDQTNESPMAFLTRLAARHDGVVKPVNGFLVLAPKGTARAVTGQALPALRLSPREVARWSFSYAARDEAGQGAAGGVSTAGSGGGVQATHWNLNEARPVTVRQGGPPYQNHRYTTADAPSARATAAAVKNRKDRGKASFSCTCVGSPAIMAEQRLTLSGFRPGLPTEWRVTTVEHTLDGQGYACSVQAELFHDGQIDPTATAGE